MSVLRSLVSRHSPDSGRLATVDPVLVALWISLVVLAILWLVPFGFITITALKSNMAVMGTDPFALPPDPTLANFPDAWRRGNFNATFFNSVVITAIKVPLGIAISAAAAYALAQIQGRLTRVLLAAITLGTMLPFQVMLAPLFSVVNGFGLLNTYPGIILPYLAFGVPYQVFILHGFFRQIPRELTEAATIDGASHVTIFLRIFLPVSIPVLTALFILDFVATWNEFAMALVILQNSDMWTLPLGLMSFQGQFSSSYGQLNAAIIMTVLPATIVYLIFQRYFVSGLTAGAVKG